MLRVWRRTLVLSYMGHIHKMLSITKYVASKVMNDIKTKPKDIFLIYAKKDEQACDIIFQVLAKNGFSVYKDIFELADSNNFAESINKAIDEAKVIIVIESAWVKENAYCQQEIKYAEQQRKKIIHVFTNNVEGQKVYRRMTFHVDFEMNDILFEEKLIFNLLTKGCVPNTKCLFEKGEELYKETKRPFPGNHLDRKKAEEDSFIYMLRAADLGDEGARSFIESKLWNIDITNMLSKYRLINASFLKELTHNLYSRGEILAEDETLPDVVQRGRGMERCAFKFMKRAIDLGYEGLDPRDYDWYFLEDKDFQECLDELGLSAMLHPKKELPKSLKIIESYQVPQIFISYKRETKNEVFPIKDIIEKRTQHKCWIDLDGIESDAQFANVIIKAINQAEIFLFMYSSKHTEIEDYENDWTIREINFAQKKRIVFVNIDGSKLTDWFELIFGTKQQVDAKSTKAMNKLCFDIQKWLSV